MTWDKPKSLGQWLLLAAPSSICVLATIAGGLINPQEGNWMAWALIGLFIATVVAFALSIYLARVNTSLGAKLGCAFACFAILMIINFAVSFAGCAVGSNFLPGMNFH